MTSLRASRTAFAAGFVALVFTGGARASAVTANAEAHHPVVVLSADAARELPHDPGAPAPQEEAGTMTQGITVTVEPGPLVLMRAPNVFTLTRVAGTPEFRGTLRGIRVVDARGQQAGWKLRATVHDVGSGLGTERFRTRAPLLVHVTRVTAMADSTRGIHARATTGLVLGRRGWLVAAEPGSGDGAFDVDLDLQIEAADVGGRRLRGAITFALD